MRGRRVGWEQSGMRPPAAPTRGKVSVVRRTIADADRCGAARVGVGWAQLARGRAAQVGVLREAGCFGLAARRATGAGEAQGTRATVGRKRWCVAGMRLG